MVRERAVIRKWSLDPSASSSVAKLTCGFVQIRETGSIEPGSVRVHARPRPDRVATHAVCLLMTGYAALQILPGSERVAEESQALVVMKGGEERAALVEPKVQVAFTAKSLGVVAGTAVADPTVSLGSVGGQEVDGVELR